MINLELPKKLLQTQQQMRMVAEHMFRPISRKYDTEEHTAPVELNELAKMRDSGDAIGGKKSDAVENRGALRAWTSAPISRSRACCHSQAFGSMPV